MIWKRAPAGVWELAVAPSRYRFPQSLQKCAKDPRKGMENCVDRIVSKSRCVGSVPKPAGRMSFGRDCSSSESRRWPARMKLRTRLLGTSSSNRSTRYSAWRGCLVTPPRLAAGLG